MYKLFIDCGANHTRGYLTDGVKLLHKTVRQVGSKDVILSGSNACLVSAICGICWEMKKHQQLDMESLEVYASGIATSPYGLRETPHRTLPCSAKDLFDNMTEFRMYNGALKRIQLIPGIKSVPSEPASPDNFEYVNIVRGEEMCALGARAQLGEEFADKKVMFLIPRSHTHMIDMVGGNFSRVFSAYSGELFSVLSSHSTLTDGAADIDTLDNDMFDKGMAVTKEYGINKALFCITASENFKILDMQQSTSYFIGVVYGGVAQYINRIFERGYTEAEYLAICARGLRREIYERVCEHLTVDVKRIVIPDTPVDFAFLGFLEVMKAGGLLPN